MPVADDPAYVVGMYRVIGSRLSEQMLQVWPDLIEHRQ